VNNALNADGIASYPKQDEIVSVHGHSNARRNIFSRRESGGQFRCAAALRLEFLDK